MIRRKTTLILGAGASYPYGFPLGETLKNNIVGQILYPKSNERIDLRKNLIDQGYKKEQIEDFALKLKKSNYMSVDAFLEEWLEFVQIGKIAIASNLINREMEDNLLEPVCKIGKEEKRSNCNHGREIGSAFFVTSGDAPKLL
jgi:hypothetical protein